MFIYLSHILEEGGPAWPGEAQFQIVRCSEISGDSLCETSLVTLPNHFGTHMDAPAHFNRAGTRIAELSMDYFIHERVFLAEIPKGRGEAVTAEDIRPFEAYIKNASLLIIKTGFGSLRAKDPALYSLDGPYLAPDCCRYMAERFKNLRALGFDFLSVGSPANAYATESHQHLLGCRTDNFICAVEDMKLDELKSAPRRVIIAPLRIAGIDSAPVTVLAEL